jgi:hypothetical protein
VILSFLSDPEYIGVLFTVIAIGVAAIAVHGFTHTHHH